MVRVRFAPSPTGYLHIGNIRAAILNYAFAKKNNGKFILRLDDTDQIRSKDAFEQQIKVDLEWLGISYDFFFRQSERIDRYNEVVDRWKKEGKLYPCYETKEELDLKRKIQSKQGLPPRYDRAALSLAKKQKETYEKEGRLPHWRFLLSEETVSWNDEIKGECHVDLNQVSDPVLIKEDGVFLYTLCSVIDDMDYKITHIIRGEDHITNTGVQLDLFKILQVDPPIFAHNSLLTDENGGPLSKRIGSLAIKDLKDEGIEAMTIISFLMRLGTSKSIVPFKSLGEAVSSFDLNIFGKSAAKFDKKEVWSLNKKIIPLLPYDGPHADIWEVVKHNLDKKSDLEKWIKILTDDLKFQIDVEQSVINSAIHCFHFDTIDESVWKFWTEDISQKTGIKGKKLFKSLRLALTGEETGPEMKYILPILGKEKIINRLKKQIV